MRKRFLKNAPTFLKTQQLFTALYRIHEGVMEDGPRSRYDAEIARLQPQLDEAKRLLKTAVFDATIDDLDLDHEIEEAFAKMVDDDQMSDVIEYVIANSSAEKYADRIREFAQKLVKIQRSAKHGFRASGEARNKMIANRAGILARFQSLKNPAPEIVNRLAYAEVKGLLRETRIEDPDLAASILHEKYPWMRQANAAFLDDGRRGGAFRLRPIILAGNPGSGKTSWSGDLAKAAGTPLIRVDLSGSGGGIFALQGQESGWANSEPGAVLGGIATSLIINPVVVVEEVDMATGWMTKNGKSLPGAAAALMSMIEPETAKAWRCPSSGAIMDLRWISWVMTTNYPERLPEPLLDRCQVIHVPQLSESEIEMAARRTADERVPGSGDAVISAIRERRKAGRPVRTLRSVRKMIDFLEAVSSRPMYH